MEIINTETKFPKLNFIGNKSKLANWICDSFPKDASSVFDAFSGGASISYLSKQRGMKVVSNDILRINYLIAKSLIENDSCRLASNDIEEIFSGTPQKGFMYNNYADEVYFADECMELDLYRRNIEKLSSPFKRALSLVVLRRAMIRKMPYSRFNIKWEKVKQLRDEEYSYQKYRRKRAYHNETFKAHFLKSVAEYNNAVFNNGLKHKAYNNDIFDIVEKIETDIIYLDPPYTGTMNNYHGFYGLLDEYIESQKKSPFENNFIDKNKSLELFDKLFSRLSSYKYWILSYNNNSYPLREDMLKIIRRYSKDIEVIEKKHDYRITGKEKKTANKEYLFIIRNK